MESWEKNFKSHSHTNIHKTNNKSEHGIISAHVHFTPKQQK